MDTTDVRSFSQISNLAIISKLLERLFARRLLKYLTVYLSFSQRVTHIILSRLPSIKYWVADIIRHR